LLVVESARITGPPWPFLPRQILGGLAWGISSSRVDLDVDLFFDEEMTLGLKIKCIPASAEHP
jgi:hypothetical protein